MVGLRTIVILTVLMALVFAVVGDSGKRHARHMNMGLSHQPPCTRNPDLYQYYTPCPTSGSSKPPTSTQKSSTSTAEDSSEESAEKTSASASTSATDSASEDLTLLERAHWCRFNNGTRLPLGHSYIRASCSLCQCTKSRAIRCQPLQCMPTYCLDDKMPVRKADQCCTQCEHDVATNSTCLYNNINYPHGTIIKSEENKMQCWCQLGNIECRNYMGSLFDALNIWADGTALYIIFGVVLVVVTFGLLLCCGGTLFFYYYYQHNKHLFQQAYDQYINTSEWQPVDESEEAAFEITSDEEKRLEAEQYFHSESFDDVTPPPYGAFNDSYVAEVEEKKL